MPSLYGVLGIEDSTVAYVNSFGQREVFDAVNELLARHNEEVNLLLGAFVDETTTDATMRYYAPAGGYMQLDGEHSEAATVKAGGEWDVAFPLMQISAQVAGTDVDIAYMTVADVQRQLDAVRMRDINTVRREVLRALFRNTTRSFTDRYKGTLTLQPLANGDAVLYPPIIGADAETAENHYLESGYAASAISDANDPVEVIVAELEEHYGPGRIVVFHNTTERAKLEALTDFVETTDPGVTPGANTETITGAPTNLPGRISGRHKAGAWLVRWDRIPANYLAGLHLDAPRPLIERVDPAFTNLPRGLWLRQTDQNFPFVQSHFRRRFGFGVGNRLNGVIMELGTGGTYTVPAGF